MIKGIRNSLITFIFVLLAIIFYFQTLSRPVVDSSTSLPDDLHPIVGQRVEQLMEQTTAKGIQIVITDDFRSIEEQDQLYEKGRTTNGNIVTYAKGGESFHNFGLAVDFAIRTLSGEVIWDMDYDGNGNGASDWMEVVESAKVLGFEWGGDWAGFKDYPHLQMDFGLTIAQLQRGERPEEPSFIANEHK